MKVPSLSILYRPPFNALPNGMYDPKTSADQSRDEETKDDQGKGRPRSLRRRSVVLCQIAVRGGVLGRRRPAREMALVVLIGRRAGMLGEGLDVPVEDKVEGVVGVSVEVAVVNVLAVTRVAVQVTCVAPRGHPVGVSIARGSVPAREPL